MILAPLICDPTTTTSSTSDSDSSCAKRKVIGNNSKIEKSLDRTSKDFSEAQKKLYEGKGNIVSRIEKIKELGAKTTKKIDERYLEE